MNFGLTPRRTLALAAVLVGVIFAPFAIGQKTPTIRPATSTPPSTLPATRTALQKLPVAPIKPQSLADLRAIEKRVEAVVQQNLTATVGLIVGNAQGSGVIVKGDGTILTAGHVAMEPDLDIIVILSDGKRVKGKTLGENHAIDSGMVKIVDPPKNGEWPHVEIGDSKNLQSGQWVVSMGHPGGYRTGRPPVVRLGRILLNYAEMIGTDCTLIGGDSGGPLFDLDGKLVGIHSRIGATSSTNIHVPVDTFMNTWDRLAGGDSWGGADFNLPGGPRRTVGPTLGITAIDDDNGAKVSKVNPQGPAQAAGLQVGDIVQRINGAVVKSTQDLVAAINKQRPNERVKLDVLREGKTVQISVKLGRKTR